MAAEQASIDEVGWQKKWADAGLFNAEIREGRPSYY